MKVVWGDGLGTGDREMLCVERGYLQRGRSPRKGAKGGGWIGRLGVRGVTLGVMGMG